LNNNLESKKQNTSVVILAAGDSERMGKPKHELLFSEGNTFLEHIVSVYQRFGVEELIIVTNDKSQVFLEMFMQAEGIKIVVNKNPQKGRFSSVQLGLQNANNDVFIQNIDNPFVNVGLLIDLLLGLKNNDYIIPAYEGKGGHPVLISKNIKHKLVQIHKGEEKLNEVLKNYNRAEVQVKDPYIHVNVNTPSDYEKYFSGLGD